MAAFRLLLLASFFMASSAFGDTAILENGGDWLDCASQGLGADTGSDNIRIGIYRGANSSSYRMNIWYPDLPGGKVFEYSGTGIANTNNINLLFSPGSWAVTGSKTNDGCGIIEGGCYRIRLGHPDQSFYDELICDIRHN